MHCLQPHTFSQFHPYQKVLPSSKDFKTVPCRMPQTLRLERSLQRLKKMVLKRTSMKKRKFSWEGLMQWCSCVRHGLYGLFFAPQPVAQMALQTYFMERITSNKAKKRISENTSSNENYVKKYIDTTIVSNFENGKSPEQTILENVKEKLNKRADSISQIMKSLKMNLVLRQTAILCN